jgi:hypothetical protein
MSKNLIGQAKKMNVNQALKLQPQNKSDNDSLIIEPLEFMGP